MQHGRREARKPDSDSDSDDDEHILFWSFVYVVESNRPREWQRRGGDLQSKTNSSFRRLANQQGRNSPFGQLEPTTTNHQLELPTTHFHSNRRSQPRILNVVPVKHITGYR